MLQMTIFFWPTSRKVLPTFQTFCPVGVQIGQMVVDLPLSSSGQEKGRLGVRLGVFCVRTYRYYRRKGFVTAESRTGVGGGILGKMRPHLDNPIWTK